MTDKKEFGRKIKDHPFSNLILEAIGYEHGFFKTIIDLYRDPKTVVNGNKLGTKVYLSPYRLLISILSVWIVINSFIIDWHKKWLKFAHEINDLLFPHERRLPVQFEINISNFGGALFAKYFVPLIILTVIISSSIAEKNCRKYNLTLKDHLEVMSYSSAINSIGLLGLSVIIAINFYAGFGLIILARLLTIFGFRNYLNVVKIRDYFPEYGIEIEKKYMLAKFLTYISLIILFSIFIFIMKKS